ncbi:hypothetical protein CMO88_01365 [Candidatus Woesearchaeota archaeon]|nr:hypothetical protein [Candidatus Woesearchaeota archaeon]|tara:strand:- start:21448 stop:22413 length:966 start_codon:yes stop_codon:yes gene_type:complete
MLKEIIEEVSKRVEKAEGNHAVFNDRHYKPVKFSLNNFKEISNSSSGKTIVFVDGGNSELVSAPGLSLQLMRNAAVVLKNNKMIKNRKREFYVLAIAEDKEVKAKIYTDDGEETEVKGRDLTKLCDSIRKSSEIKFASEMLSEGAVVFLDGTLEAENDIEKQHFDDLYLEASKKKVTIAAVAKTTTLTTEKGSSFAAMLDSKDKNGAWYYYPVAEIASEHHKAEMLFAKMHEKSSHVFRTEIHNQQKEKIEETIAELKENSRDLTFPGYPYGLILADKLARVSDRETDYVKAKLFATAGNKWNELRKNLAAVNAHEILDSM